MISIEAERNIKYKERYVASGPLRVAELILRIQLEIEKFRQELDATLSRITEGLRREHLA
jgi:hypothetical protein